MSESRTVAQLRAPTDRMLAMLAPGPLSVAVERQLSGTDYDRSGSTAGIRDNRKRPIVDARTRQFVVGSNFDYFR